MRPKSGLIYDLSVFNPLLQFHATHSKLSLTSESMPRGHHLRLIPFRNKQHLHFVNSWMLQQQHLIPAIQQTLPQIFKLRTFSLLKMRTSIIDRIMDSRAGALNTNIKPTFPQQRARI